MHQEYYNNFQYDSCVSRGICSVNPRTSALQTVLVLYLRLFAKFAEPSVLDFEAKEFILNTITITINNLEFNEKSFLYAVKIFKERLPILVEKFSEESSDNIALEIDKAKELFEETTDINKSIQYGEKIFNRASEKIGANIRDLYNIVLVVIKSMSINLLELETFDKKDDKAFGMILKLLSKINLEEKNIQMLKTEVLNAVKIDYDLMVQIRNAQEERYGKQGMSKVSYSTFPNKAVLVVGSNIRELEIILNELSEENIDVYTHDDMMLAHTFPKFSSYDRLKGQFGQGLENCLLDFATFPGPIILTKNSLHNIENFYRGHLFTTDYTSSPKGIIKIENNDFSKVIESAKISKGFKTGRQCESVNIGFDYDLAIQEISSKLKNEKFKRIFVIGIEEHSIEQKVYFQKLVKMAGESTLIISFSYFYQSENFIHINTCFDYFSWIKIIIKLISFELPITVFIPRCQKNSISQMIYLSDFDNIQIFVGKCTPILLNPSLMNTLKDLFSIESIETVKKDLEKTNKDK